MLKASKIQRPTTQKVKRVKKPLPGTKRISSFFETGVSKDHAPMKKSKTSSIDANIILLNKISNVYPSSNEKEGAYKPYTTTTDGQLLVNVYQPFHPGPSHKFPRRKISGVNRGCASRLFDKYPIMTYNECNDSVTYVICENTIKDDNFAQKYKYDNNEFTKYGFRGYHRHGKRIEHHIHSRMHKNAVSHCAVNRGFNNN